MGREDRDKLGKRAVFVAIAGNLFLTIFNVAVGIMAGSYALISEGAHTLTDITTSIIAYIGFKIGSKPADEEHPLGHGRAEAIAGLLIVIFLAIVAYEIITGAIERLFFGGTPAIPDPLAVVMAIIGVITHFSLSQYIINLGERANSPAIIADAKGVDAKNEWGHDYSNGVSIIEWERVKTTPNGTAIKGKDGSDVDHPHDVSWMKTTWEGWYMEDVAYVTNYGSYLA